MPMEHHAQPGELSFGLDFWRRENVVIMQLPSASTCRGDDIAPLEAQI
jgi:hypothetical protein